MKQHFLLQIIMQTVMQEWWTMQPICSHVRCGSAVQKGHYECLDRSPPMHTKRTIYNFNRSHPIVCCNNAAIY